MATPTTVPVIKNTLVKTGPGKVLWAPIGTALPVFVATTPTAGQFQAVAGKFDGTMPTGWLEMGPTDAGLEIAESLSQDPVEVEESYFPVRYETTSSEITLSLSLAHINKQNIQLSRRGGTFGGGGAGGVTVGTGATLIEKYTPPVLGAEVGIMICHINSTADRIYIGYSAFQSGAPTQSYRKGADKVVLGLEYRLGVPDVTVSADGSVYGEWYAGTTAWT